VIIGLSHRLTGNGSAHAKQKAKLNAAFAAKSLDFFYGSARGTAAGIRGVFPQD
jgi:hypothetical protein